MSSKLEKINTQIKQLKEQMKLLKRKKDKINTIICINQFKKKYSKYSDFYDQIKLITSRTKYADEDALYYNYYLDIYLVDKLRVNIVYAERDGENWCQVSLNGKKIEYYQDDKNDNEDSLVLVYQFMSDLVEGLGFDRSYVLGLCYLIKKIMDEDISPDWDTFPIPNEDNLARCKSLSKNKMKVI